MSRLSLDQLEDYIRSIDAANYTERRNYLGSSTGISEYVTRGAISLPRVRALILETNSQASAYKFINELAWREYWQSVWNLRGDGIFEYIRPLNSLVRQGIPKAVVSASTGINAIDASIRQLKSTGYIHNHERMWLAGLICNVAHCEWKVGANWMHSQLIDGDYASNHLSWQWVAGAYTGKAYLPQQQNINTYSQTVQNNTYLDVSYDVLADIEIPQQLEELCFILPINNATLPPSTTTIQDLNEQTEILLYSPWTLDPSWRADSPACRVLLLDTDELSASNLNQNVIDSIVWFANEIPNLKILCANAGSLNHLAERIIRKSYPGITGWPGSIDAPQLLFPNVANKLYNSFSAFWKQAQKS